MEKRCTLLIPDYLLPFYEELRDRYGGLRELLSVLIKKFSKNKTRMILKKEISSTLDYQEEGLNLHRADFRPVESEWVQLKLLAGSHNLSMCAFISLLLRLEMAGALELNENLAGYPPIFPKISLYQSITLYSVPNFTRILYLRL